MRVRAPINIAIVKYWGKRDEKLVLPTNDSLSVTLHISDLCAETEFKFSENGCDEFYLNGMKNEITFGSRLHNLLELARQQSRRHSNEKLHISSTNNFPTAAGLASSAAGLACMAFGLHRLLDCDEDVSLLARIGSGSACRSVYGGFVAWQSGVQQDGRESIAVQLFPEDHWPSLRVIILVVSDEKKGTGSTRGMQTSVATSALLKYRAEVVVPNLMKDLKEAISLRDFSSFANICMKESNQLHAICLDTLPPIFYLNSHSHSIINLVHQFNSWKQCNKVAYTFDAGPNACIFFEEQNIEEVHSLFSLAFPHIPFKQSTAESKQKIADQICVAPSSDAVKFAIHTSVGPGPQILQ